MAWCDACRNSLREMTKCSLASGLATGFRVTELRSGRCSRECDVRLKALSAVGSVKPFIFVIKAVRGACFHLVRSDPQCSPRRSRRSFNSPRSSFAGKRRFHEVESYTDCSPRLGQPESARVCWENIEQAGSTEAVDGSCCRSGIGNDP